MTYSYPAIFHKEADSVWAEFPDLDGCQTFEKTQDGAYRCAKEALTGYILTLLENHKGLPEPSNPKTIPVEKNSIVALVTSEHLN